MQTFVCDPCSLSTQSDTTRMEPNLLQQRCVCVCVCVREASAEWVSSKNVLFSIYPIVYRLSVYVLTFLPFFPHLPTRDYGRVSDLGDEEGRDGMILKILPRNDRRCVFHSICLRNNGILFGLLRFPAIYRHRKFLSRPPAPARARPPSRVCNVR